MEEYPDIRVPDMLMPGNIDDRVVATPFVTSYGGISSRTVLPELSQNSPLGRA